MLFPVAFLCLRQLQLMYIPTPQGTDFFYPYVMQILKQKYIFKDLFITHHLGNLQRFVKFLLNSQKYQTPKSERKKKDDNYATSFSHTPLSFPGGRKRQDPGNKFKMYVLWFNFILGLNFIFLCFGVW